MFTFATVAGFNMKWSYGVTTVPSRFKDLLPRTLRSLAASGFASPRLFVDGSARDYSAFSNYSITVRDPIVRTFGNWVLAAWELYLREPQADRYAIFQDDFVTYRNLRQYLETIDYPKNGYCNLYTFPENTRQDRKGWYLPNGRGLGAVALVFSNESLRVLLRQEHMVDRPLNAQRGHRAIDGGIVSAMRKAGWREYVHNPSLVQHTGDFSSMDNGHQPKADTFRGEEFDALELLERMPQPKVQAKQSTARLGLVGYHCATGLGELNRQISTYGQLDAWLIQPHPGNPTFPLPENLDAIVCANGNQYKVERFLKLVDTLIFCERPFYRNLTSIARSQGKRLVCIPMMEWMPAGARGWPREVDLFICPTKQCYDIFSPVIPCVYFPWPVDTARFQFQLRTKCERFLFVGGHGGWHGRKGTEFILKAKELWPEMPLAVRSQQSVKWPSNVEVLPTEQENSELYSRGDVLIAPHCVDGLGLEPMEAMACGMPVITTDGLPWNEIPAIGKIRATSTRQIVQRPVDWYAPDPHSIVSICKELLGQNIEEKSREARAWAEGRSWEQRAEEFIHLVKHGKGEKVAA